MRVRRWRTVCGVLGLSTSTAANSSPETVFARCRVPTSLRFYGSIANLAAQRVCRRLFVGTGLA